MDRRIQTIQIQSICRRNIRTIHNYSTPECSHVILKYLEYREKQGDTLKPTSPLIYRKQMRYDNKDRKMIIENQFNNPMDSQSVQQILTRLQRKSAVLPKQKESDNLFGEVDYEIL